MANKTGKPSNFWQELKRRKVIRVIFAYAAVGFAIIELIDIIGDPLNLPDWALTMVIVLVAVGFPIAIVLAWAYDISPSGIEKTESINNSPKHLEPLNEKSIIVLPLDDISPHKDNEYFADGLTEEITADLSQIRDLLVISRSSAMTFKGTNKKIKEIASDVNVRYVLEGSVRKVENKIRITAQLIDSKSDTHIWAQKYDGILDDVFDMQEKVSKDILTSLKIKLSNEEKNRISFRPIDNIEAYDYYLRAYKEFWRISEEALNRGLRFIQQASDIIGENHLLYSAIALLYVQYSTIVIDGEEYVIKSEQFAKKALALNPDSSTAFHVMGYTAFRVHGNPNEGLRYLKQALAIEPTLLPSLFSLAALYCYCGKIKAAGPLVERIKRMDPLSYHRYYIEGLLLFFNGEYKTSIGPLRHAYELDPQNPINWFYAWALAHSNKQEEAINVIDGFASTKANKSLINYAQILKYTLLDDKEKVLELMTPEIQNICRRIEAASYFFSSMLASLGEKEKALDFLDNAVERGFLNYPIMVHHNPFFDSIKDEEKFKTLMKKVNYLWKNFKV